MRNLLTRIVRPTQREQTFVIISVRDAGPVTGGGGLRVSKLGKRQDKGKLGKLGKFHVHVYSGNVHASDCGSAHCSGCMVDSIFAKTAC